MTETAQDPIAVLLLDDNPEAGPALARWFSRAGSFSWLGQVATPEALEEALIAARPHVVLVGWHRPDVDTPGLVRQLVTRHPSLKFVVISEYVIAAQVKRCLYAGARGFSYKGAGPAALAAEVRLVAEGRVVLSVKVQDELADDSESAT